MTVRAQQIPAAHSHIRGPLQGARWAVHVTGRQELGAAGSRAPHSRGAGCWPCRRVGCSLHRIATGRQPAFPLMSCRGLAHRTLDSYAFSHAEGGLYWQGRQAIISEDVLCIAPDWGMEKYV